MADNSKATAATNSPSQNPGKGQPAHTVAKNTGAATEVLPTRKAQMALDALPKRKPMNVMASAKSGKLKKK